MSFLLLKNKSLFVLLLPLFLVCQAAHSSFAQTAPVFTSTPFTESTYGTTYEYNIEVDDEEGDILQVSLDSGPLPDGVSFDSFFSSASISGIPTETGDFPITLRVRELFDPSSFSTQSFTITVSKAILTVTADNKNISYGEAIPTLTFSYSGFVNDDTETDLDTPPTASTTASAESDAGEYPITLSGGADDNYTFNYVDATLTIEKIDQEITFDAINDKTYGDAPFELSASASSGLPVSFSVISGNATISGNTLSITGTGDMTVQASQEGNENYNPASPKEQTFNVARAPLTVSADDKTITYGDPIPTLTFTYSGFVNNEDASHLDTAPTASTTATQDSNIGDYPITLSGGNDNNYSFNYEHATLTIEKVNQNITFDPINDKTYGDPAFTLSASANTGLPITYSVISGNASISGNTLTITGAGDITVQASQEGNENYSPASAEQTFNVAKAPLTVTADNKTIPYGTAIPTLTFTYSGFLNEDDESDLDTAPTISTQATTDSEAGTYPITLSGGNDENYTFNYVNATLTIEKANQTITFNAISDKTYGDEPFTLSASATSGLPVSFSIVSGNASISGNTLTISGAGNVTVKASQPGNENYHAAPVVERSFTVHKAEVSITITGLLQNYDGSPKEVTVSTSPEGLSYTTTYDGSTQAPSASGEYQVEVNINETNYTGTKTAILIINSAPVSSGIEDLEFPEDSDPIQIDFLDYFSDTEDEDSELVFEIISNTAPELFSEFSLTGSLLTLSVEPNISGTSNITVRATDSNGMFTNETFSLIITPVQDPPIFTSEPVTEVLQDELYSYEIEAIDYDEGDILTITNIISLPTWLNLTDNGDGTALLSGTPGNNQVGSYGIALKVSDDKNNTDEQFFDIEVIDVNDPPVFTSTPVTQATVNVQYTYHITTNDIDQNDEVSLTILEKPSWLNFTDLENGSGRLQGTPRNSDRAASRSVRILAEDLEGASAEQSFTIEVDFPNRAPEFTSTPVTSATQDQEYLYEITVTDPDDDEVSINLLAAPDWLTFETEGNTASLSGIPTNQDVGSYTVVLEAEDFLGLKVTQNFTITVENVNDPPIITSEPATSAIQNILYEYVITVEDPDEDDEITISVIQKPEWLNFDGNFTLSGTPSVADVENSPFMVELIAEDSEGASDNQSFEITVRNENLPPTIDPIPDTDPIMEDTPDEFTIPLTGISTGGESNQQISITASTDFPGLFESLSVDYTSPGSNGVLKYTIMPDSFGIATVTVHLQDDGPEDINFTEETFKVTVSAVNDAPEFTSDPVERALAGTNYSYEITGRDADPNDVLVIEALSAPSWLNFTDNGNGTAILEGQVPVDASDEDIALRITDSQGEFAEQNYRLRMNQAPTVDDIYITMQEDSPYEFGISELKQSFYDADDDNLETIKFNWSRGTIQSNGQNIEPGQEIDFSTDPSIQYIPPSNFFGEITLQWSASDGYQFSEEADIFIKIDSVNDAPVLSNIETSIIDYIQGSDPIKLTETITVTDVDDQFIDSAFVQITENYNPEEDRISMTEESEQVISGSFDRESGVYLLTGKATKSAYETALRQVTYENVNPLTSDEAIKSLSIKVSDGLLHSEPVSRELQIINVLPELDIVNAFTPDGNGVNDTWDFVNLELFEQVKISVFNNNGMLLYNCSSRECEWDGTYKGELLPAGTYFYLIDLNNGRRKYEGTVTILK
ncbi:gliding motility-associated C-terminal domain-containing protein [Marivirga sp. S37H4]|uniref:Gliding motility-associated C-terminal domain-containing protein n=1 Tax=Marivirga aurantiaca TaxID=2802615 RepID=A0A934X124_9BACT|nr:MBG domain-containing protein [Marivirga aurantiaca]MBK6266537.1 gliding motility-associated C-terminal domain-containing protein [Marivirga aurantiaca]